MKDSLKQIYDFAAAAHAGQRRKFADEDYIHHPHRVMLLVQEHRGSLEQCAAALLHDVLEDTAVSPGELSLSLLRILDPVQAGKTMQLVIDLTDVYVKSNYPNWNRQKRKQAEANRLSTIAPEAQTIKYADITDNAAEIVAQEPDFAPTFLRESKLKLESMKNGDADLRERAMAVVELGLRSIKKPRHRSRD